MGIEALAAQEILNVNQKKNWGEALTGIETRNRYSIADDRGSELFAAAEQSWLLGLLLGPIRPFTILVLTLTGNQMLKIVRRFRFYFYRVDVSDDAGTRLGSVVRRFAWFGNLFDVLSPTGELRYQLRAGWWLPVNFDIIKDGEPDGMISKQFAGVVQEMFTDADRFSVVFPERATAAEKAVLLGAVFLLDFTFFERSSKSS
jgi:hypothetical protein